MPRTICLGPGSCLGNRHWSHGQTSVQWTDICPADRHRQEEQVKAQVSLTVAESKRLIAKGVAQLGIVRDRLQEGVVMVSSGTTNAYIVEELLGEPMDKRSYVTGRIKPAGKELHWPESRPDVVLRNGQLAPSLDRFSAIDVMGPGDIYVKGANALNYQMGVAGVLIGHPRGGTIGGVIGSIISRKMHLLIPVGLEKEVAFEIDEVASRIREPNQEGDQVTSLFPMRGIIFTEIEALYTLSGVEAYQAGAGGIAGAEGGVWLVLEGTEEQVGHALAAVEAVQGESPFDPD
jgi:hypothetical protein